LLRAGACNIFFKSVAKCCMNRRVRAMAGWAVNEKGKEPSRIPPLPTKSFCGAKALFLLKQPAHAANRDFAAWADMRYRTDSVATCSRPGPASARSA
jgi:hypothetical protein